jgi:hypothetical protein
MPAYGSKSSNPTNPELKAICAKIAQYQSVFETHQPGDKKNKRGVATGQAAATPAASSPEMQLWELRGE